jgi:DNA-binding LacI/PurR family transcriptional regulator
MKPSANVCGDVCIKYVIQHIGTVWCIFGPVRLSLFPLDFCNFSVKKSYFYTLLLARNPMKSSQVTIKDIARQLSVSPSTVSRALQGHPDISEETKRLVNELAARLKYQPNAIALSLKNQRTRIIGVIIPEIVHYFFSSVISGIEDVAYNAGFNVIICQSNERFDRELSNVKTLIAQRVDGILVSISKETTDFQHLQQIVNNNIPLVFYDRIAPGITADQVIINDSEAAYQATKHMIDQGRKRIAHFAGPQNLVIGQQRKNGFLKAVLEAGLEPDPRMIVDADNYEKAQRAIMNFIGDGILPDAIFAVNDITAIGAMKSLQKQGLKIPDDVALVGFSDGRFSGITEPALSSVDQHGYEMGITATEMLLKRILEEKNTYPPEIKILEGDLIIRGSSRL